MKGSSQQFIILICIAAFISCCVADESSGTAHVVVSKKVLNHFIVENKHLTVLYSVYNIGDSMARDVEVNDNNFQAADMFSLISGTPNAQWSQLAPGANVTHAVVFTPLQPQPNFNFTAATFSYKAQTDSNDMTFGVSSAPGQRNIVTLKEFNRAHNSHLMEWIHMLMITAPTIIIPYMLWYMSSSKYEKMSRPSPFAPTNANKKSK